MTWGVVHPVVLLPADCGEWPADRRDVVLRHELAHVARRDVLTLALAQVACAVHWFNPLSWVALHQLRAEAERCCDDWVLSTGTRASAYAGHLLEMVRVIGRARVPAAVVLPMAQRSTFEGRLLAILEPGLERGAPGRRRTALTAGGVAALVLAVGAMRPAEARAVREIAQPFGNEDSASGYRAEARVSPPPPAAPAAAPAPKVSPKAAVARTDTPPPRPDIEDLAAVGVDAAYITGLRAAGYDGLTGKQLIAMRAAGVTPENAREMNALGWGRLRPVELTGLRIVGVTAAWLDEMRRAGVQPRTADDAIGMRAVGVTVGYVAEMGAVGFPDADAEDLTDLRAAGVTGAYVRELAGVGLTGLSIDELTTLRARRIDAAYVRELRAAGVADLTAGELIRLRRGGVEREHETGHGRP